MRDIVDEWVVQGFVYTLDIDRLSQTVFDLTQVEAQEGDANYSRMPCLIESLSGKNGAELNSPAFTAVKCGIASSDNSPALTIPFWR